MSATVLTVVALVAACGDEPALGPSARPQFTTVGTGATGAAGAPALSDGEMNAVGGRSTAIVVDAPRFAVRGGDSVPLVVRLQPSGVAARHTAVRTMSFVAERNDLFTISPSGVLAARPGRSGTSAVVVRYDYGRLRDTVYVRVAADAAPAPQAAIVAPDSVRVGTPVALTARVPAGGAAVFKSATPAAASVTPEGVLTARDTGVVRVRATVGRETLTRELRAYGTPAAVSPVTPVAPVAPVGPGPVGADTTGPGDAPPTPQEVDTAGTGPVVEPPEPASVPDPEDLTPAGPAPETRTANTGLQLVRPELPRRTVDVRYPAATGRTIAVAAGGSLQRAINSAQPGDVITLEPGARFVGNYELPRKSGNGWIVIRTAASDARLPAGSRVRPAQSALMARIETPNSFPAIRTLPGAHHYRLVGLEITAGPAPKNIVTVLNLGANTGEQRTPDDWPRSIIVDRSYVHGQPGLNLRRCIVLNGAEQAVVDSYVSECHAKGADAQAILGWNGPGPYRIENNHLEGSGENVMFGGAGTTMRGNIPSDITIRRNYFFKPLDWKGVWTVKNLFELKYARRVLLEDNVLENCWVSAQTGYAINIKSSGFGRDSAYETSDVTVRRNVVRNSAAGVAVAGKVDDGAKTLRNVLFEQNLFYGIGTVAGTKNGRMVQLTAGTVNLAFVNNTFLHADRGAALVLAGGPKQGSLTFVRNAITGSGRSYGVQGNGRGAGYRSLPYYWPRLEFSGNALIGFDERYERLPQNSYPASPSAAGLPASPMAIGDFASARAVAAPNGTAGADLAALRAAVRGVDGR